MKRITHVFAALLIVFCALPFCASCGIPEETSSEQETGTAVDESTEFPFKKVSEMNDEELAAFIRENCTGQFLSKELQEMAVRFLKTHIQWYEETGVLVCPYSWGDYYVICNYLQKELDAYYEGHPLESESTQQSAPE